jgi:DNA polymerase-3 subunit chi
MTRVDFYHDAPDRLHTALRIVRKAYQQRLPLLVYAPDAALAARFDHLLWSEPATGFLPHCRSDDPLAPETPVLIAGQLDAAGPLPHDAQDNPLLLNLADEVPPGFARFRRVIEIVSRSEADKAPGRARFKFYRDRGFDLTRHDLSGQ